MRGAQGEILQLGRLLEESLVTSARWGAWAVALERCLDAARAIGNRSAEAWALHELGSRALCLGDAGTARALLNQAVKLREGLDDAAAVAASRAESRFRAPACNRGPRTRAQRERRSPLCWISIRCRCEMHHRRPRPFRQRAVSVRFY